MIPRATPLALCVAAALAGCETAPTVSSDIDAAAAVEDLGTATPSARCNAFGDGGSLRAQGAWRVVAYEAEDLNAPGDAGVDGGLDAGATSLTRYTAEGERVLDPATGNATVLRVNGALRVTSTTVRLALGLLRDDRFAIRAPGTPYVSTYEGTGVLTAEERRFVAPGAMVGFEFCAGENGLVVASTLNGATRRIYLAPDTAPTAATLSLPLRVRAVGMTAGAPLMAPRTAVLWEVAGRTGFTEALAEAAVMRGDVTERTIEARPPQGDGTARYAVGHPALYDDRDGDGRFDPARDALRSVSSVALAWRDPGANLDSDAVASRLRPGLQVVALHTDGASGGVVPVPMDLTRPVPLECAATEAPTGALPDVVR
ncbi:MAG: hypothetical protein U0325_08140 [Polyangiales bacterium]